VVGSGDKWRIGAAFMGSRFIAKSGALRSNSISKSFESISGTLSHLLEPVTLHSTSTMRINLSVSLLASVATTVLAIYKDDAFQTDYQHAFVGIPQQQTTFFHRPSSSSKASLLYTLSEKGVLGAINPKDGALVWRQLLTAGQNITFAGKDSGCLRAGEGDGTVISGLGGEVRAWGALDGKMAWGNEFEGEVRDLEVLELEGAREKEGKDVVLLMAEGEHGVVRKLEGSSGKVLWEFQDHRFVIHFAGI
jgi:hypothetical protein